MKLQPSAYDITSVEMDAGLARRGQSLSEALRRVSMEVSHG
jgi:hypothetical protein